MITEINNILRKASSLNIKYVVLKNLNHEKIVGMKDIDIFIEQTDYQLFKDLMHKNGYFNFFDGNTFLSINSDSIPFDIHINSLIRLPIIQKEDIFKEKQNINGVLCVCEEVYFILETLKKLDIFGNGRKEISSQKLSILKKMWERKDIQEKVSQWIELNLGSENKIYIRNFFDLENYNLDINKIRLNLIKFNLSSFRYFWKRINRKLKSFFTIFNKSHIYTFMGIDGSGKTTMMKSLSKTFSENGYKIKVLYLGSKAGFRLPLSKLAKIKRLFIKKKPSKNKLKIEANESGVSKGSLSYQIFLIFEYIYRLFEIKYFQRVNKKIIITDRYIYDFVRENIDSKIVSWFEKLFPKPDMIFFMYGNFEVIHNRKPQYSIDIIENHQIRLKDYLEENHLNRLVEVDAEKTAEENILDIMKNISNSNSIL